jgi:hypothetical protein
MCTTCRQLWWLLHICRTCMLFPDNSYHWSCKHSTCQQTLHRFGPQQDTVLPDFRSPTPTISLSGDICHTILISKKNKGAGINSNSIDHFVSLVKCTIPSAKPDLRFIFEQIYQNNIPLPIKWYFTDVYLFCLHKDPTDHSKLCPLCILTATHWIIANHVAHTLKSKFALHLFSYNFARMAPTLSSWQCN